MGKTVYIEHSVREHPRAQAIIERIQPSQVIECDNYREVFNPKSQNFRLQKTNPAIILAHKTGKLVLPTPEGFGIGGQQNYYFSHMLNCLYDCRYCFLQGMYPSAHHVIFVNYEDFADDIDRVSKNSNDSSYFFSGYDCDSLAYEPVTGFLQYFLSVFEDLPNAILELRTKSTNVRELLKRTPLDNVVAAFSFTPDAISQQVEHKVPSVAKRIDALAKLANAGWKVGLRLDPLIYADNFRDLYAELIDAIFSQINPAALHSVSIGPLRFPEKMYRKVTQLYPEDKLLAHPLHKRDNHRSYLKDTEEQMKATVIQLLHQHVSQPKIFECSPL